jgi:hypothetical protein
MAAASALRESFASELETGVAAVKIAAPRTNDTTATTRVLKNISLPPE